MSDSVRTHRRKPTRLPRPWDSPGKKLEWGAISHHWGSSKKPFHTSCLVKISLHGSLSCLCSTPDIKTGDSCQSTISDKKTKNFLKSAHFSALLKSAVGTWPPYGMSGRQVFWEPQPGPGPVPQAMRTARHPPHLCHAHCNCA